MANWFHRLMNPHCTACREEKECLSCDELRSLLHNEKREKQQLLDLIVQKNQPVPQEIPPEVKLTDIKPSASSWRIRQQLLENEDRAKAESIKRAKEQEKIGSLERDVGISSA